MQGFEIEELWTRVLPALLVGILIGIHLEKAMVRSARGARRGNSVLAFLLIVQAPLQVVFLTLYRPGTVTVPHLEFLENVSELHWFLHYCGISVLMVLGLSLVPPKGLTLAGRLLLCWAVAAILLLGLREILLADGVLTGTGLSAWWKWALGSHIGVLGLWGLAQTIGDHTTQGGWREVSKSHPSLLRFIGYLCGVILACALPAGKYGSKAITLTHMAGTVFWVGVAAVVVCFLLDAVLFILHDAEPKKAEQS